MRAGLSPDRTVLNDEGIPWVYDKPEMRLKAKMLVMETKPRLLIGSPMCRAFSILKGLKLKRMREQMYQQMLEHGRTHLKCLCAPHAIESQEIVTSYMNIRQAPRVGAKSAVMNAHNHWVAVS